MRIYDLLNEQKEEKTQGKLTQEQLYEEMLKEQMADHSIQQTKDNRSNHATK